MGHNVAKGVTGQLWAVCVHVKAVKPSKEGEKDNLDKAICETLKYSVKPSDIAKDDDGGDWLHEMTKQTLNMRFIATGGVLKGVLKPEEEVTQENANPKRTRWGTRRT